MHATYSDRKAQASHFPRVHAAGPLLRLTLSLSLQLSWMMMMTRVSLILLGKMLVRNPGGPLV